LFSALFKIQGPIKKHLKVFYFIESLFIFATEWLHKINKTMKRDVFQAIADPTRRAIIVLIAAQAMTPNALAEKFDTTRQAVSKHIKILQECDVVEQQKVGREIYYHFNAGKMKEIDGWLEQFRQHWENRFNQLDEVLNN
jgi:DNA-binding transcriptional ArsR family regulator